jgi:cytochrome b6-f complex iron-sulfur subunit
VVCTGCAFSSCGSKSGDATPSSIKGPTAGSGNVLTADLTNELTAVGQSKSANGVILARTAVGNAASSFSAVQVACTHQGTSINYNAAQGIFICPNHGSEFNTSGVVLLGPATTNLQKYNIAINANVLTVSA